MSKKLIPLFLALAGLLHAQSEPAKPLPSEEETRPLAVPGDLSALTVDSPEEGAKYVIGGINVGATFDDNAFSDNSNKVGDINSSVHPYVGYRALGPTLDLSANYGPGWSWDQRLSDRNVFS